MQDDKEENSLEAVGEESTNNIQLGEVPDVTEGEAPDDNTGDLGDADSAFVPTSWPESVASCTASLKHLPPLLSYDREGEEIGRSPPLTQHQLSERDQVL